MEEIITKQDKGKLMEIDGRTRGMVIRGILRYILKKEGEEGLNKTENILNDIGFPIKYKTTKELFFYPLRYEAAILLIAEKTLGFNNEDFIKIGEGLTRIPFVVRAFLKYFSSIALAAKDPLKMFTRFYKPGNLKVTELNQEERYVIIKITKDFKHYPTHCRILEGFFAALVKMITKSELSMCKETKCIYRGNEYHEFTVKW